MYTKRGDFSEISDDLRTGVRDVEVEQILNDSMKIKKKRKERKDISKTSDDLNMGVRDVEVEQILNDSVKIKKRKKKHKDSEDISEINDDIRMGVMDVEVENILNDSVEKYMEGEDFSGTGTSETSMRDDVTVKVNKSLNNYVTIKKRKEQYAEREDFSGDDLGASLKDIEVKQILNDSVKRKKRKKKSKRREEFPGIVGDLETIARGDEMTVKGKRDVNDPLNSDEYLPESAAIETVSLQFSGLRENKGKYKKVADKICATSLLADKEKPPDEGTDVNDDIVADVESGKKKRGKQKKLPNCQDKEMYSNLPCFSDGADKLSISNQKLNNSQSVYELGCSDAVKKHLIAELLDNAKKNIIASPTLSDKYDILKNIEYGNRQGNDSVVLEKVNKTERKNSLKMKKDSLEVEVDAELGSKEIRVDKIDSTIHLQDGSSTPDGTLSEEIANNVSTIIENDSNSPLRQGSVHVFDEEEKDVDRSVRRNTRQKFRLRSGGVDKSKTSHSSEDGISSCELENENSPSDIKSFPHCQTTMKITSIKDSKKSKCYYSCSECNRVYTRKDNLAIHKKVKHECTPMFKCSDCGKSFQYKHVLKDHILCIHGDSVTFDCELCSYKAKKDQDLERHVTAMHEGMVFPCLTCGNTFKCESNLRRHMKIVHFKQNDFVCALCGKFFSQAFNLKQHMKNIHLEKTTICMICECQFENRQKLSMHLLGHAPKVGFNCQYCDYVLVSKSDARMKRHVKEKHSDMDDVHAQKTCIICEREFEDMRKLRMHLLGHAPKVGLNCQYCDYVSESDNRMKRHIKEKHLDVK